MLPNTRELQILGSEERRLSAQGNVGWELDCRRWGQVGFWEKDPQDTDIEWWKEVFRRTRIDAVVLNAGPGITFYPSKLRIRRSRFLGERDFFGEFVAAARSLGIRVMARIDSWGLQPEIYHDHPDWAMVDPAGEPMVYRTSEMLASCPASPYLWEFIPEVLREVLRTYEVDGIFDRGGAQLPNLPLCHCLHCQRRFRTDTALSLPTGVDWDDHRYRQWLQWRYKLSADLWEHLDQVVRSVKPWAFWQGSLPGHDLDHFPVGGPGWQRIQGRAAQFNLDHQGRDLDVPPTRAGEMLKLLRVVAGDKPAIGIFAAWYAIGSDVKRACARPSADMALWMAETVACGVRPWWHSVGASNTDRRWLPEVERFYQWHAANQEYLLGKRESTAQVAMVFSRRTLDYYGRDSKEDRVCDAQHGMYHALLRERIAFDWLHEDWLTDSDRIGRYRVLVLANTACLSDAQCGAISEFARKGGSVIATFETSLYDEWGTPREDYGLSEILGVHRTGRVRGPLGQVYQLLRQVDHPILSGIGDTDHIPFNGSLSPVDWGSDTQVLATLVPKSPSQPPETTWPPFWQAAAPTLLAREVGGSRVVYFPGDTDRQVWRHNFVDMYRLLGKAARWALGVPQTVEVKGPGLLDVHPFNAQGAVVVHMVNIGQHGMWKAPVYEILPLPEQTVLVQVPDGVTPGGEARFLVSGGNPRVDIDHGSASITVPGITGAHEVLVLPVG